MAVGRPELSKAMLIYQCLLSDQRPWQRGTEWRSPMGKLEIHMGEWPRQANTTTSAVVYGRITESEESRRVRREMFVGTSDGV